MKPLAEEKPLIIAMKGHPGTGKTTLARAIATTLKYPLIDKDDVKDCTLSLSTSTPANQLNDFSYQVIWQIAKTQLNLGLSLVIDSPLSRRAHLDHLREIAAPSGARVFVVECVAGDEGRWREQVERRGCDEGSWHKPGSWEELKKLIEGYKGCYNYDVGDVPKVVVDTTSQVGVEELVSAVLRFIVGHGSDCGSSVEEHGFGEMGKSLCI